jgi:peptide/nickel transport system ATP-binding protein/oligopeptide transport system ATP-binding protein
LLSEISGFRQVLPEEEGERIMPGRVLVSVSGLTKHFVYRKKFNGKPAALLKAVDGVDIDIYRGQTLGLVGESGCGKSTLGRLLLRLHKPNSGSIVYNGIHLENLNQKELRPLRRHIQIIFQDPYDSLNPRKTVFDSVLDPLNVIAAIPRPERNAAVEQIFHEVGLDESHYFKYPHELSGGQRQRVVIARAVVLNPDFIVCDEPVSALDVSIRAQILKLMIKLRQERKITYLFISHDLSVVRYLCDTVAVMYLGKIVEFGTRMEIFNNPAHPYTQALISAIPLPDVDVKIERTILEGDIPSPVDIPPGCRFRQRCRWAIPECARLEPSLNISISETHKSACFRAVEIQPEAVVTL